MTHSMSGKSHSVDVMAQSMSHLMSGCKGPFNEWNGPFNERSEAFSGCNGPFNEWSEPFSGCSGQSMSGRTHSMSQAVGVMAHYLIEWVIEWVIEWAISPAE